MINEKSLENLKVPKPRKAGYGYRYAIPQAKIDELFTYLAEGKKLKPAAKAAGMCFETARKYFSEGDITRGIKPLSYRLSIFQDRVFEKFNVALEERRMIMLGNVRDALDVMQECIKPSDCKCCAGECTQTGKDGIKILCPACSGTGKIMGSLMNKANLRDLDRLTRLEVFLMGGVTQKEHEKKGMTAEEISGDNTEG